MLIPPTIVQAEEQAIQPLHTVIQTKPLSLEPDSVTTKSYIQITFNASLYVIQANFNHVTVKIVLRIFA